MALSWLLLSVRCKKNNIQHCDGFVMASAQCQMQYLWWLCHVLSVRCTKKQYTTLWWLCRGFCSVSDVQKKHTTLWWLCHGFCSVSDVQKNNIQHCDGFVVASAQCQMYKKTTYNTVMALSWLLLSVRCTKKQHTTLWWLCRGFCSVSDVQKNNIQHCDGFVMGSAQCQMYKQQYTTMWWLCHGFVMASTLCQMYKKTI